MPKRTMGSVVRKGHGAVWTEEAIWDSHPVPQVPVGSQSGLWLWSEVSTDLSKAPSEWDGELGRDVQGKGRIRRVQGSF